VRWRRRETLGDGLEVDLGRRRDRGLGDWFDDRLRLRFGFLLGGHRRRGLGRLGGALRRRLLGGRLLLDRGLLGRLATEPFGVGQTADAVGERIVDARRVALDSDLQALAQVEDDLVVDAQFTGQLIDPNLLGGQSRYCLFLLVVQLVLALHDRG